MGRSIRPDSIEGRRSVNRLAREGAAYINIASLVLLGVFGWLQVREWSFGGVLSNTNASVISQVSLVAYYLGWIQGTRVDVTMQNEIYVAANYAPPRWQSAIAVAALIFVGVLLLSTFRNPQYFGAALFGFAVIDVLAWLYLRRELRPVLEASQIAYGADRQFSRLEELEIVEHAIFGQWKWYRLAALSVPLCLYNVLVWFPDVRAAVTGFAQSALVQVASPNLGELLPALCFACFVLVSEVWSWTIRIRCHVATKTIARLSERYSLIVPETVDP